MKHLLVALLLCAFSGLASAQETEKPWTEMSYEELLQVDQSDLNKEQKKFYKKTLRTAKKAWQKAEKARKRAEKERERAEKKRLRAEAKQRRAEERARKKHNKPILKQLENIDKTYSSTVILRDDFEAFVTVTSEQYKESQSLGSFLLKGSNRKADVAITSLYNPNDNQTLVQLHVSERFSVDGVDKDRLKTLFMEPAEYLTRNNLWHDYTRATMRGGIQRPVLQAERYMDSCYSTCYFREEVVIELELSDLIPALQNSQPFQIKLSSRNGSSIIAEVPLTYMYGHLLKLSELDPRLSQFGEAAKDGRETIEARLQ